MKKRFMSLILAMLMTFSLVSTSAFALEVEDAKPMPPFNVPIISSEEIPPIFISTISSPSGSYVNRKRE